MSRLGQSYDPHQGPSARPHEHYKKSILMQRAEKSSQQAEDSAILALFAHRLQGREAPVPMRGKSPGRRFRVEPREYMLVLDPSLRISPDEFSKLWNTTSICTEVAQADVERTRGGLLGVDTINEALVVLGNIAIGVASSALYDLVTRLLAARGKRVSIQEQSSAHGDVTVVVKEDSGPPQ